MVYICLGVAYIVLFNYEFFTKNWKVGFGFLLLDSRKLSGWQKIIITQSPSLFLGDWFRWLVMPIEYIRGIEGVKNYNHPIT